MVSKTSNSKNKTRPPKKSLWHICDDCLVPLSVELQSIAGRFNVPDQRSPTAGDLLFCYRKFDVEMATEWLKYKKSVTYGENFRDKLLSVAKRFRDLEHKACQILNGDVGKGGTTYYTKNFPPTIATLSLTRCPMILETLK